MDRGLLSLMCVFGGALCAHAGAQTSPARAAESVEMVAGLDLGLNEPVTTDDYQIAMHLMSMALELNPADADLARSVAQAAWSCGNHEELINATRVVVRNDPADTVAQLRLISAIINRHQTVDERIAAYERFLGEGAESIDPSVRSRLMVDRALLERELGDEIRFLSSLRKAAKLDPANKEAQSLVAQHYSQIIDDASVLMRLQLRVLYADPLDPNVIISIARMCAAEGATDVAWRFLNNGIKIFKIDNGSAPSALQEQQLSLLWQYEGPQAILDKLNPSLSDERATTRARIEARIEANEPFDDIKKPMDIRYDPGIDRIRLLAAAILEDQETIDSVLLDLERSLIAYYQAIQEQMKLRGVNKGQLLGGYLAEVVTFQTMRAIVGVPGDEIEQDITTIIENAPELEPFFRPFEPFSMFAMGEYQQAMDTASKTLSPSASRDVLIALSAERLGQSERAIELYTQLTLDYPLQAVGSIARSRLEVMTDGADMTTPEGAKMREIAQRVPEWFDHMITSPQNTMSLSIRPLKTSYAPGERAKIEIRLSNLSTLPLSLGSAHPIDSNMLVVPGFREIDGEFKGIGRSSVVDLGRRLRLKPLEEMIVVVDPDSIQSRWLIQNQPQSVVRQRWRGLQGFKPMMGGGIINSPFSLVSETQIVERRVLGEASMMVEDLIETIRAPESDRFERGVLGAAAILIKIESRPDLTEADLERIVDALWERYLSGDTATRIWMLGTLPVKLAAKPMNSFDERVKQTLTADSLINPDIDPLLVAMVLVTRVEMMGSSVFDVARGHPDERLGWMADLIAERIRNLEPMYAGTDNPFEVFSAPKAEEFDF